MAILVDHYSCLEYGTRIVLEINLKKNNDFDFCPNRADYLNWIPFEFILQIGENESYVYPEAFGATFSLEELKYFFRGIEILIQEIKSKDPDDEKILDPSKPTKVFRFYTLETYFGIEFVDGYGGLIGVSVWVTIGLIPNWEGSGFKRGFSYTVNLVDLEKFKDELQKQLSLMI